MIRHLHLVRFADRLVNSKREELQILTQARIVLNSVSASFLGITLVALVPSVPISLSCQPVKQVKNYHLIIKHRRNPVTRLQTYTLHIQWHSFTTHCRIHQSALGSGTTHLTMIYYARLCRATPLAFGGRSQAAIAYASFEVEPEGRGGGLDLGHGAGLRSEPL